MSAGKGTSNTDTQRENDTRESKLLLPRGMQRKTQNVFCVRKLHRMGFSPQENMQHHAELAKMSCESGWKQTLKVQLKFRKVVLKQTFPDKSVFQYSIKGKQLTSCELLQNMCKLMDTLPC